MKRVRLSVLLVLLVSIGAPASFRHVKAQGSELLDRSAFFAPPMEARPGIRWWWPGGDVTDQELARELDVIKDAGFGSVEVQSFAVGLPDGGAPAVRTYGTSSWYDHFAAAVSHAQSLGIKVDFTLGSAWPSGGTHINDARSLQQLTSVGALVTGPGVLDADFPGPREPIGYGLAASLFKLPNTFVASKMTPVALFAVKLDADQTSDFPYVRPVLDTLPALPPTTYLDASSIVDLSPFVSGSRINWPIPNGSWVVFAFYQGPTGSQPFYAAEPTSGLVLDHLSEDAVAAHLQAAGQATLDRVGDQFAGTLGSLFVDSPELRTELYWTADFLTEFATRRGYRLEPFLPVLFRPFNSDAYFRNLYRNAPPQFEMRNAGREVRYDYDQTVSELMVERFFAPIGAWAGSHGIGARIQAHGAPADLLNAYATATVPETEGLYAGGRPSFLKIAASAAHTHGKAIVSSEVLALKGANATPRQILAQANQEFAAGVNQLVMHGFPYIYDNGFPTPGWMPFNSPYLPAHEVIGTFGTHLNDTSPFWRFMPDINRQIARTQLALRTGEPVANIALFTDRLGYPDDSSLNPEVNRQLERSGQSYDYVNADLLASATIAGNTLRLGTNTYSALVIDNISRMPVQVAGRLVEIASSGVPVIFVGDVPFRNPGYFRFQQNDAIVNAFFEQLFGMTRLDLKSHSRVSSGSALYLASAADLGTALAGDFQLTPDLILSDDRDDVHFAHRRTSLADYYFLTSSRDSAFDTLVSFAAQPGQAPLIFDLPTGKVAEAPVYSRQGGRIVLPVHLEPGMGVLVGFELGGSDPLPHLESSDIPFISRDADGNLLASVLHPGAYSLTRDGETVSVAIGGATLPVLDLPVWDLVTLSKDAQGQVVRQSFPQIVLNDLSLVPQLRGFVGTAVYAAPVTIDQAFLTAGVHLVLNLGQVFDAGEVRVNDRAVGTLTQNPFHIDITNYVTPGINRIEVGVTVSGAPAGMIGPINIIPIYQAAVNGLPVTHPAPVPFTVVVTPPNFQNSSNDDMIAAIGEAAQLTNHVNFQWFWKTPPTPGNPDGGAVVSCQQVGPWVAEAKRRGLGVTLQFQTFVTQLVAPNTPPNVRIANPVMPFDQATFANAELATAYLDEIVCLANLEPDYLVLGPEMNFVVSFNFPEFQRFQPVYRRAYEMVKALSPTTQVGLSWQYDGLRSALPFDTWDYISMAGPEDFIGLTTYFGYSDDRFREYPAVASIPADYYRPIRARFGPQMPIVFTEVGYSSVYPNGLANQADFLQRLPALLDDVRPVSVSWSLLHDVNYFTGPSSSLNQSGMLAVDGTAKPVWARALALRSEGRLVDVVPRTFNPAPMPFSVTAGPPFFPATFSEQTGLQAIATASGLSGHVSLQFAWKDRVTGQVWDCAHIAPYAEEARRLGDRFTIQFNTYSAVPPSGAGELPGLLLLNPMHPPESTSMSMPDVRDAFIAEVACLAGLQPDYLVLGPEVNFLLGARPSEFFAFAQAFQVAYATAKAVSPHTQVGVSYQYDAIVDSLTRGDLPWYMPVLGAQDFAGLTSYFAFSADQDAKYPFATDVPYDYYDAIRKLLPNTPIVFTEVGWSSHFPHGRENQVLWLNRLLTMLARVKPVNVIWALQHDVENYFTGEIAPLNDLGMRYFDGTPKPVWDSAIALKARGLLVTPQPVP